MSAGAQHGAPLYGLVVTRGIREGPLPSVVVGVGVGETYLELKDILDVVELLLVSVIRKGHPSANWVPIAVPSVRPIGPD